MPKKGSNWKHRCCAKIRFSEIISPHGESCFNKNRETFLAGGPRSTVRDRAETLFYHGPRSHSLTRCRQFYGRQFALFSSSKVNFHDVTLGHPNKKLSRFVFEKEYRISKKNILSDVSHWNSLIRNFIFFKVIWPSYWVLKFIYSEKATKFCEISTNYLTGSTQDK